MSQVYWLEQCSADVPLQNDWLSLSEVSHLLQMRFPKRQADWRLGRWTAKRALAAYLALPACAGELAAIEIRPAESGAPDAYVSGSPAEVAISLSHREHSASCAVAPLGTEIGCDLEAVEPRTDRFIADYLTGGEREWLAQMPVQARDHAVALLWSGKESVLKALRIGLRLDTRCAVVCPLGVPEDRSVGWHPLVVQLAAGRVYQGWWQKTEELVRTVVAAPPSRSPVTLKL
jgi:4'-phosphopantetheinyl transferase